MLRSLFQRSYLSIQQAKFKGLPVVISKGSLRKRSRAQSTVADKTRDEETTPSDEITEYPKALKVNGQYVLPWMRSWQLPSLLVAAKWFLRTLNNSSLPGGKLKDLYQYDSTELDQTLPVIKPDKATLYSPVTGNIQVTWVGHATVLIQMGGLNILTDPVFNDYCGMARLVGVKRYRPVPCSIDELPDIDAVCISHSHYDHLDYTTVCELNKRFGSKIHWLVPMGLRSWMKACGCKNIVELEWWDEYTHPKFAEENKATRFTFTPAQHWSRRGIDDTNKVLWGSWCITGPKNRFFFAADTGYCEIFKQIGKRYGPFDLAAIPIGAYEPRELMAYQHVNPDEAVKIHQDVRSNFSLGIHWGTFNLSFEHYLDPPKKLNEALTNQGISETAFCTIRHGETKVVSNTQRKAS